MVVYIGNELFYLSIYLLSYANIDIRPTMRDEIWCVIDVEYLGSEEIIENKLQRDDIVRDGRMGCSPCRAGLL